MENHIYIREYTKEDQEKLADFMEHCLPESGRRFEPNGAHRIMLHVEDEFEVFICAFEADSNRLIGTSAFRPLMESACELKCVYLYKDFHGQGIGTMMCNKIMAKAKSNGYKEMYLDTITETSQRAIAMYKRLGFTKTEPYHESKRADLFMKRSLM